MVEEAESPMSFTVYAGNRCFVVAAPSEWQRDRWLEDISRAILAAKTTLPSVSTLTSNASAFLGLEASISSAAGTADNTEDEEPKSERSVNTTENQIKLSCHVWIARDLKGLEIVVVVG
ncbi:FERM ARHGEF and pleckstrin domain-containing protein 2 [Taenia solium]|eukprot:TsM_000572600 transcript=TsM_000572600 gene=TsM_000572600